MLASSQNLPCVATRTDEAFSCQGMSFTLRRAPVQHKISITETDAS